VILCQPINFIGFLFALIIYDDYNNRKRKFDFIYLLIIYFDELEIKREIINIISV